MRVKIVGAGSIGNHIAHAARRLGWQVVVTDIDPRALARMRDEIYPSRYDAWDPAIELVEAAREPRGGFDVIHIGTPPDSHLPLARRALDEAPRGLLIEKPLCTPSLDGLADLVSAVRGGPTKVFVGYDHVVGRAMRRVEDVLRGGTLGEPLTIDVDFREHWAGIFAAHPWLRGPADSYLGHWRRGGGASGEHSHATNLWQHLAHVVGKGPVVEVSATITYVAATDRTYDNVCLMDLRTSGGLAGRVAQDVVTSPPSKRARVQCESGAVEWVNTYDATGDAVRIAMRGREPEVEVIPKRRPDDFIDELRHIEAQLGATEPQQAIALGRAVDTMLVVAAAHRSEQEGRRIRIDRSADPGLGALS